MERFIISSRNQGAAWPTKHISYPIGARFAYVFAKLGFSPNAVSLIGLAVALLTVVAVYFQHNNVMAAIILFVGLEVSYIIDCADGVLARAMNRTSPFGAILDKLCDGLQTLVIPLFLVWIIDCRGEIQVHLTVPLMITWVISSSLLTHTIWFKSIYITQSTPSEKRKRGFIASVAAILIDNPTTRLLVAVFWAFDLYFHFAAGYAAVTFIIFIGYIFKQYRILK